MVDEVILFIVLFAICVCVCGIYMYVVCVCMCMCMWYIYVYCSRVPFHNFYHNVHSLPSNKMGILLRAVI